MIIHCSKLLIKDKNKSLIPLPLLQRRRGGAVLQSQAIYSTTLSVV